MRMAFGKKVAINFDATMALMLFFALFLSMLFIYLFQIDRHIKEYALYHDVINEMALLDKEFDNFTLQNATFMNYDTINAKVRRFEENLNFLDSPQVHDKYAKEYKLLFDALNQSYMSKMENIELFKSQNASLLNSVHYLFDLYKAMEQESLANNEDILVVHDSLLMLMKYYINTFINTDALEHNLKRLGLSLQQKSSIVEMFILHASISLKHIDGLTQARNAVTQSELGMNIKTLHHFTDQSYQKNIFIQRFVFGTLFVAALLIVIVLILMHRRSIMIQDELLGFKIAVENSDNSIVITDAQSNITYVNEVFERESGYTKEEAIGQNPRILKTDIASQSFYDNLHQTLSRGEKWNGEFVNRRKDGSLYHEKASIMPVFIHGKVTNYLAIKLNITEYINQKREVEFLAYHDALTLLPNRTNIEEYLQRRLEVAKREHSKLAVLFIDLDRFKMINDTLGHDVGDELLVQSSKRIKEALREADMLARIGGDEFIVVLEALNDDYSAAHVCKKILALFKNTVETSQHHLNITLSIGIALYPDDGDDYKTIFKHADIAMYKAKESGKNTYKYYRKQLSVDVHERLEMEQTLKEAIGSDEFYMVYQPKYDLKTREVVALEALVRWESRVLGFVSPGQFIPVAEEAGYILELGLFTFKQACQDFLELQRHAPSVHNISVNISAVQLYQENFLDDLMRITKEVNISPNAIVLEITESHIMKNIQYVMDVLNRFKAEGFDISIDDFGTGHSSMSYLKRFPIDELKIDKSFVDDLPHDLNDAAITKAIIALSKSLGYINVAEGIENEKQEMFLQDNGCEIGQGYYFCKPLRKKELLQFLDERNI